MNEFQFECPKCGQNILAAGKWSGRRMTCPSCETRLIIPSPDSPPKKGGILPLGIEAPRPVRIRVKLPARIERKPAKTALVRPPASKSRATRPPLHS